MRFTPEAAARAIWTEHATDAARSREVTPDEVDACLSAPDTVIGPDDRGRYRYACGSLAVVVRPGDPATVVTVLWRTTERWTDAEMRRQRERFCTCATCADAHPHYGTARPSICPDCPARHC